MKRRTLYLTQGDPHRIYVREFEPGTTARIQVRRGDAESTTVEAEWVEESATPTEIVYVLSGEAVASLIPGVAGYVWEMELVNDGQPETVVGGGVVIHSEIVKA